LASRKAVTGALTSAAFDANRAWNWSDRVSLCETSR